jgi:hypothetical protein
VSRVGAVPQKKLKKCKYTHTPVHPHLLSLTRSQTRMRSPPSGTDQIITLSNPPNIRVETKPCLRPTAFIPTQIWWQSWKALLLIKRNGTGLLCQSTRSSLFWEAFIQGCNFLVSWQGQVPKWINQSFPHSYILTSHTVALKNTTVWVKKANETFSIRVWANDTSIFLREGWREGPTHPGSLDDTHTLLNFHCLPSPYFLSDTIGNILPQSST